MFSDWALASRNPANTRSDVNRRWNLFCPFTSLVGDMHLSSWTLWKRPHVFPVALDNRLINWSSVRIEKSTTSFWQLVQKRPFSDWVISDHFSWQGSGTLSFIPFWRIIERITLKVNGYCNLPLDAFDQKNSVPFFISCILLARTPRFPAGYQSKNYHTKWRGQGLY